ncbi:MAG: hypothetical protein KIT60_06895 [Burkholderiaceae bacterium]|nr:hypothetical protein [Burkholderiaceae bacterium]
MARPPKPTTPQHAVQLDNESLARASAARDEIVVIDQTLHTQTAELAQRLGYDGPLQPELLELEVRQSMQRSFAAFLDTGRLLLLLKERVGRGAFMQSLERLGMPPRGAQKFMQAALKFSNAPTSAHFDRINRIAPSKVIELLVLDDEEVKGLLDGDSVRGVTLDKVDTMCVSELRAALREAHETVEAKQKLIEHKNAENDKLRSAKKFKPSPDSIARSEEQAAQLEALDRKTVACLAEFNQLADIVAQIDAATDSPAMRGRAHQAVQFIVQRLVDLIGEQGIEIDLSSPIEPPIGWGMPGLDIEPAAKPNGKGH